VSGVIISGDRRISFDQVMARARQAAAAMASAGIRENDAVACLLRNDFCFFEAAIGAGLLGAYLVPVNWHSKVGEVEYVLNDCGAKLLIAHADLARTMNFADPSWRTIEAGTPPEIAAAYSVAAGDVRPRTEPSWDEWIAPFAPWDRPPPSTRLNMIYTSGTTGRPKGVRRMPADPDQAARMFGLVAKAFGLNMGGQMRTVVTGPVYHSAPNMYALSAVQSGGLVVLQSRFDAEELLALIEQHRITHLHMVPTMFVRLLKMPAEVRARYDVSSLRFVVHAAAPCPAGIKRQMVEWWGPIIHEYYGGTETGGVVFHGSGEALDKPGTVGRAFDGCSIRILDAQGQEVPTGKPGEIYLRNNNFPDFTYHGMPEERRKIERDGYVTLGEIGYLDADGYLFLLDRAKDMIISGGVNIYPAEIEAVLVQMPGVKDCAVFGIPDAEYGEQICAVVEPHAGTQLNEQSVKDFLRQHLAGFKTPKVVEFSSALPREDSGKIFKRLLRDAYWAREGRLI